MTLETANCAACGMSNAASHAFCVNCGAGIRRTCVDCRFDNPKYARFCAQCGTPFPQRNRQSLATPALVSHGDRDGELKQLTVLFADLAESTKLIDELDPESASRRLTPALEAMKESIRRFDGSTVRMQGDGVMALFGAPKPQEDHAVRACCAALAMQVAVAAIPDTELKIRIGIHSGEVLVRTISTDVSNEYDAVGVTVHMAARLEQMATDGGILLSEMTWRAARHLIETDSLGLQPIRGLKSPMLVHKLKALRRGPASQRFRAEGSPSPLVGRSHELARLQQALSRAADGDASVIGVVAEAGVGKSRLCYEFAESCRTQGIWVIEGRAFAHSQATPFEPIVDLLFDVFSLSTHDEPDRAREKITARVLGLDGELRSELPLLFDFLGFPEASTPPSPTDPAMRRDRLQNVVRRLVRSGEAHTPTLIVIEDLHWIDDGSKGFLQTIVESIARTSIVLLVNFRPGFTASWMGVSYYEQLSLAPLRSSAVTELATELLGQDESVRALSTRLRDLVQGNPFYLEELVRTLADRGLLAGDRGQYTLQRPPDALLLPGTVQAVVSARIDLRPDAEKDVLQNAAVIGREFTLDVLRRVTDLDALDLRRLLHKLAIAELLYELSPSQNEAYAFRHPMTQEVAYRSLPTEKRRRVHGRVAGELETTSSDPAGADAAFIAYHFEEANNPVMAAAKNAGAALWYGTRDSAQAITAWKNCHRLLHAAEIASPQQKFSLLMAAGQIVNLAWREGLPPTETETYFREAMALARELGDMRAVTLVTAAYGRFLAAVGSADDYLRKVQDALRLVQHESNRSLQVTLLAVQCHAQRLAGLLQDAMHSNTTALDDVEKISTDDQKTLGFDIRVWLVGMRAQTLAMLGKTVEAKELAERQLGEINPAADPLHALQAHATLADIAWATRDGQALAHHSTQMREIAEKAGSHYLIVYARFYLALSDALAGMYDSAARHLEGAVRYARERRAGLENEPRMLATLASVQLLAGEKESAARVAEEALTVARKRHHRVWAMAAEEILTQIGGPSDHRTESAAAKAHVPM